MKKLLGVLLVLTALIFTGCDNNEGPFEIRREDGHKVLYSNGKLAKGMIKTTWYDYNSGETVVVSEYYVDKGVPAGNFILYDRKGEKLISFEGEVKNGLFIGKMTRDTENYSVNTGEYIPYKKRSKGEYTLNPDWLLTYDGEQHYTAVGLYSSVLKNGKVDSDDEKYNVVNGNPDGKVETYFVETGKISGISIWENGDEKFSISYYENDKIEFISDYVKDENGDYTAIHFKENGQIDSIRLYPDLEYPSHESNLFSLGYAGYLKFGPVFDKMTVEEILDKYSKKYNFELPKEIYGDLVKD